MKKIPSQSLIHHRDIFGQNETLFSSEIKFPNRSDCSMFLSMIFDQIKDSVLFLPRRH